MGEYDRTKLTCVLRPAWQPGTSFAASKPASSSHLRPMGMRSIMATTNVDRLNSLLRGEISATETYTQAVQKFSGQPEEMEIRRMRDEHRDACNALRHHIHQHGATPDTHSGSW